MSAIQELLRGRNQKIEYENIVDQYPWILEKGHKCIISPDSDGLLCGLFMSYYLDWKVVGFYDGKIMVLKDGVSCKDCVFLDIEIFREEIRSMGQHMLLFNRNQKPTNWGNFKNCLQPNNLRDYDIRHDFRLKFPLATIHFLIGIVGSQMGIKIPDTAIRPLFFTDGTYNVLFKYTENVLHWLKYLRADEITSPLKSVFENQKYTVFTTMVAMEEFFKDRDDITVRRERGDRLKISTSDGHPYNILADNALFKIDDDAKGRIIKFIQLLANLTTWNYNDNNWTWDSMKVYKFTKRNFKDMKLNGTTFSDFVSQNPLSWAATSGQNIEYTLEQPDKLP